MKCHIQYWRNSIINTYSILSRAEASIDNTFYNLNYNLLIPHLMHSDILTRILIFLRIPIKRAPVVNMMLLLTCVAIPTRNVRAHGGAGLGDTFIVEEVVLGALVRPGDGGNGTHFARVVRDLGAGCGPFGEAATLVRVLLLTDHFGGSKYEL